MAWAKAIALPALLFLALVVCAGERTPQIKQDRDSESFRISVDCCPRGVARYGDRPAGGLCLRSGRAEL